MHPFMQDVSSLISEFYMEPLFMYGTHLSNDLMSKLIVGSLVRLNAHKTWGWMAKKVEQTVQKSAQMCKIEVARG